MARNRSVSIFAFVFVMVFKFTSGCNLAVCLPENYDPMVLPLGPDESLPKVISVRVSILAIQEIEDSTSSLKLAGYLESVWKDHRIILNQTKYE